MIHISRGQSGKKMKKQFVYMCFVIPTLLKVTEFNKARPVLNLTPKTIDKPFDIEHVIKCGQQDNKYVLF